MSREREHEEHDNSTTPKRRSRAWGGRDFSWSPCPLPPGPLPAPAWLSSQGTATLWPGWSRSIHLESRPGQAPEGKPVKTSVAHECGKGYATACYKVEIPPRTAPEPVAAMDRNRGQVAVVYGDGAHDIHRHPDTRLLQIKLKRVQRKLARQQKDSRRRHRTRTRLQKLHRRIRTAANTWRHRLTRNLADKARLLVLEKLHTRGMTRSAQGTMAEPGNNVQQKAGPNRSILAMGWSEMEQMLSYTTRAVYVNPAYPSRRCCRCGQVDRARRSQSAFHCTSCGYQAHADLNAAQNILACGVGAAARGEAFSTEISTIRETGPGHSCD